MRYIVLALATVTITLVSGYVKIYSLYPYGTPLYNFAPIEHIPQLDFIEQDTLDKGKTEMKKRKVIFAGITRDNALKVSPIIKHIEHLG
jgi:hypothetical protein